MLKFKEESVSTSTNPIAPLKEKLLRLEEFSGCAFAGEPRLYSYQQAKHLEFAALLLNPLNAPVLVITKDPKNHRVLFKDYPTLKYLITPDSPEARVVTSGKSFPLEVLLTGAAAPDKERIPSGETGHARAGGKSSASPSRSKHSERGEPESPLQAGLLLGALVGAVVLIVLLLTLLR